VSTNITEALQAIEDFQRDSLKSSLSRIESAVVGLDSDQVRKLCAEERIDTSFIASARSVKKVAGQINVIIHAAGIICSLPHILEPGETVESVSLGAGNTGRKFDLETNFRIAEYKFIDWRGGAESVRQNGIFKDFFELSEHETFKRKYLYVVGTTHSLKFLKSGRTLASILSKQPEF
jgi:hypothetical protein